MRDYTKFFTPEDIAKFMVKLANPKKDERWLEPHAGDGAIVKEIKVELPRPRKLIDLTKPQAISLEKKLLSLLMKKNE